jgi:membrane-associated phospholipid phosphatase
MTEPKSESSANTSQRAPAPAVALPAQNQVRRLLQTAIPALKNAAQDFHRQWRQRPIRKVPSARTSDLCVTAYWIFTIVVIAVLFDAMAARAARQAPDQWQAFFAFVTGFGKSGYLFLFSALICVLAVTASRMRVRSVDRAAMGILAGRALFVFAVLLGSGIASQVLKRIGRARPKLLDQGGPFQFDPLVIKSTWASMPSGHTITIFAFAIAIGYFLPRWRFPLLFFAVLVGVSRVMIGAHYPSDVVAGACIGVASAIVLRRIFAARRIVFRQSADAIIPRGHGIIFPSLHAMAQR